MRNASPLRYPGGKWRLARFFERLIDLNYQQPPVYVEPYAGGASLALSLLFAGKVSEIHLNDLDPAIHAFWYCVLRHHRLFSTLVERTPVTAHEWERQKTIYAQGLRAGRFALGFATFFLNRTSYSGILNGGMIGGKAQKGTCKIDARFNRAELVRRIGEVAGFEKKIHLSCEDATSCLSAYRHRRGVLCYLDPPYYRAGRHLYLNAYRPADHAAVREWLLKLKSPWVVSYDDVPEIRSLYRGHRLRRLRLLHTARTLRQGHELMFFSSQLRLPVVT
jgi:DNA adenine methylase